MSLLLTALALAGLAFLLYGGSGTPVSPVRGRLVLLAYLLPALFLLYFLFTAPPEATRFRMALLALGERGTEGKDFPTTLGGDAETADVWISGFAEETLGTLHFRTPTGGEEDAVGTLELEVPRDTRGALVTRRPGSSFEPIPAIRLADGDLIHDGQRRWTVRFVPRLLGRTRQLLVAEDGAEHAVPRRMGRLPLIGFQIPIRRSFSIAQRTHPLRWLARQQQPGAGRDLESFFFRRGGEELWLAALDAAVTVEREGQVLDIESQRPLEGGRIHAVGLPVEAAAPFTAGGVRDRRSFRATPGRRSLLLSLDTPEVHSLTLPELCRLAEPPLPLVCQPPDAPPPDPEDAESPAGEAAEEPEAPSTLRVNLALGDWQITDRYLHFRHASRALSAEAFATLAIPADWSPGLFGLALRRAPVELISPHGQFQVRGGEPFWLGRQHLAAVQVDLITPPRLLALLALLLALTKAKAARSALIGRTQLVFAAALETLVAVRLLFGYRVWAMPPFKEEGLELALVAWMLLPWTFLVLSLPAVRDASPRWRDFSRWFPALGGWTLSLVWCWQLGGGGLKSLVWAACHLLALAVPVLRCRGLWDRLPAISLPERLQRLRPRTERHWLWLWCGLGLVLGAARALLLFLGFRESLPLGGTRLSLSLIHVPLALLLEAGYLIWLSREIDDRGELRWRQLLPALAILVGTWIVPALMVSDLGLALLHMPVFLLALASLCLISGTRASYGRPAARFWVPTAALVAFLIVLCAPVVSRTAIRALPAGLQETLGSERNFLRVLAFADADRLVELARRSSEELAVMGTVLDSYTGGPRPFLGRGYFASEISPHIEATALREHSPAVFLAAEMGLAGILGLLLLYTLMGTTGPSLVPWRSWFRDRLGDGVSPPGFWGTAGGLAALTVAVPSLYMVMANYGLVLFTGRNTYLLALDSAADVLETFLLATLVAAGAALLRDEVT